MKKIVDHFYYIMNAPLKILIDSTYKILIGSFEFNRKPVEILLTACY